MIYEEIPYQIVSNALRGGVTHKRIQKNYTRKPSKIIEELMAGKTVLIDSSTKWGDSTRPHKTLYNYFSARGRRLRMHLIDDMDIEVYRGILLWVDNFYRVWRCARCTKILVVIGETRPRTEGCTNGRYPSHWWVERPDMVEAA